MTVTPISELHRLQPAQFVRGEELMSPLLLPNLELPEGIGIGRHVAVVDGLIDKGAQLAEVLGHGIHTFALLPQPGFEVLQHGVGQVGEVQTWPELLELADGGEQVLFRVWSLVGGLDGRPGECRECDGGRCLLPDCIPQQGQCRLDAALPKSKLYCLQVDDEFEEQRIEFDGLRVVDYLGRGLVPVLRLEVDVGSEVDVTLLQLGLYLHKGVALVVELVLAIVHKAISYLLHGI